MGGVMKFYSSGTEIAKEMGIDPATLKKTFDEHSALAEKMAADPDGGPFPAYPTGKSWDKWGKKFYHNTPNDINDEYHVAIVTPSIHYCVVLDKSSFCGGNSTKATSGINGAGTSTQKSQGIADNTEIFLGDTLKGGAKKPEVAKVLCAESGPGVEWLIDKFELDLSLVARLGGHSQPRTHRGQERFPGMTITYALMQRFEKLAEQSDRARIVNKAYVFNLLTKGKIVIGCEYAKGDEAFIEYGPVILCSGGFGADFTNDSLLAKYRPDLLHLPTTNGEHCTGDGIKMGERVGAKCIDLEWVQVHPTGLVKPDDPDAKVKFLAAEALRGVGGVLIDRKGERFANELGRRDYVTGQMWKNDPPFRLCLNKKAATEIHWHCEHYKGRGGMFGGDGKFRLFPKEAKYSTF